MGKKSRPQLTSRRNEFASSAATEDAVMETLCLIHDKQQLRGTCYFEFLPGIYKGQCWNEGSVFLSEEAFSYLEPVIQRHESRFDHYAFTEISKSTWMKIVADLERLTEKLGEAEAVGDLERDVGFFFSESAREFAKDFRTNANRLSKVTRELMIWLQEQLQKEDCVSVLGI
jgi:hypothetical protein